MGSRNLQVLPLHKYPEYLKACCDLINDEWPRSETARMMSLQASCDELPTSLILVDSNKLILGHSKLTAIPSIPESCFLEAVVIKKSMRGQRLGSYLMHYIEDYCRSTLKLKMIHLSTKGQEDFYSKLGYEVCAPVSIYGVRVPSNFKSMQLSSSVESAAPVPEQVTNGSAPPPPPPMPKVDVLNSNNTIKTSKTYMYKHL